MEQENNEKKTAEENISPVIRVLLTDSDFASYDHAVVTGVCGGQEFACTPDSPELKDMPLILEGGEEGITLTSLTRACGSPTYQGTLEIYSDGDSLHLINEVPLETYLESVVPSEMPASFDREALMAQAVCARTYAWKRIKGDGVQGYDADVDDSVSYQVYGNISPQESTTEALRDTEGLVLCQNGSPVDAYYFSTSAGVTSTDEIWGAEEAAPHLKSVECDFDSGLPWSRWEVVIPWEKLQKNAEAAAGQKVSLTDLEIIKKSQSGAVTGLKLLTDRGEYAVETEYRVREFLSPRECMIREKDGSEVPGGSLLPSAYFTMEIHPGKNAAISGGGYGHGVGMSQNGAAQMAEEGYNFREILEYFFRDTEIMSIGAAGGN